MSRTRQQIKTKQPKKRSQTGFLQEDTLPALALRGGRDNPQGMRPETVVHLQRTVGNRAVQHLLAGQSQPVIQRALKYDSDFKCYQEQDPRSEHHAGFFEKIGDDAAHDAWLVRQIDPISRETSKSYTYSLKDGSYTVLNFSAAPVFDEKTIEKERPAFTNMPAKATTTTTTTTETAKEKKEEKRSLLLDDVLKLIMGINPMLAGYIKSHANFNDSLVPHLTVGKKQSSKNALIQAALLTYLTVGERTPDKAATIKATLEGMGSGDIQIILLHYLPQDAAPGEAGRTTLPAMVGDVDKKQKAWKAKNFSDPGSQKNMKKFRYIVIALQNQDKDKNRAYKYMDFLENPGILQNFMNSTSVIDEKHRGTYTPYGFIIRVPQENVAMASPKDIGIANQSADIEAEVERSYGKHGLPDPKEILEGTVSGRKGAKELPYNEVVVRGRTGHGVIKVTGIYIKTQGGKLKRPLNTFTNELAAQPYVGDELLAELRKTAARLGVPLVYIDETDPSQDKLERLDEKRGM